MLQVRLRVAICALGWLAGFGGSALAQPPAASGPVAPSLRLDGPPAPIAPEVVSRDSRGRATIRAVRIQQPLEVDGSLDEEVYQTVRAATSFIEQLPRPDELATEQTELWVLFDDRNIYVSARCFDSHPALEVANEMRRDSSNLVNNESISLALDTFYDRRNGFSFQTTPLGIIRDQQITDDSANDNWNTIWDVKTARTERGWTFEMVIPFKSLRYDHAGPQVWGFNVRRIVKWKNEYSYLSAVPLSYGIGAVNRMGAGGTLVGVETPAQSINLEVKPYATSSVSTDRTAAAPFSNDLTKNAGFDFKYGVTRSLIADATVNTDFAQVEEDVQQVNLTRFNLFFPEKRDFFLEGLGIFSFAGVSSGSVRGGSGPTDGDVPILFFSRQIGLNQGFTVPVIAGGRLAGKAGPYSIGLLNIETGEKDLAHATDTNFSVIRLKRDVLRRSNVGLIYTRRAPTGGATNTTGGVDANFQLLQDIKLTGYWARTSTPGAADGQTSYRAKFEYDGDRYGFMAERGSVGRQFNPGIGFMRRIDYRRTFGELRFSPRPKSLLVRQYTAQLDFDYVTNASGDTLMDREVKATFAAEFQNSDKLTLDVRRDYEFLPKDFGIATGVLVPLGGYAYQSVNAQYALGQQRRISGTVTASRGTLYNGDKTEVTYTGRAIVQDRFGVEPGLTLDWVNLPYGSFTARLVNTRLVFTPTPRMVMSSLLQYNDAAHTLNSSIRFSWEYIPGSQLFVVYSDGRNTFPQPGVDHLMNRSFAVKVTRLLRL